MLGIVLGVILTSLLTADIGAAVENIRHYMPDTKSEHQTIRPENPVPNVKEPIQKPINHNQSPKPNKSSNSDGVNAAGS